jgi:hypothetical protein
MYKKTSIKQINLFKTMAKTIASELNKLVAKGAIASDAFTGTVRASLNTLRDGDIITFPTDLTGRVISQEFKQNGQPRLDADGNPIKMEFILVDVKRGNANTVVQFFPSFFTRMREKATAEGQPSGEYMYSEGEVVDFVHNYDDQNVGDAIKAIGAHGAVKVEVENFKGVQYDDINDRTNFKVKTMSNYKFTWA